MWERKAMKNEDNISDAFRSLLDCAKAFGENEKARLSADAVAGELSRIADDAAYLKEIAVALIPSGMEIDASCTQRISRFIHKTVGFSGHVSFFVSLLKTNLTLFSEGDRVRFLWALVEPTNNNFWSYDIVLKDVLPHISLSAEFLAEWLLTLARNKGNYMAGGNAFAIAFAYSRQNPEVGIQLVEIYLDKAFDATEVVIVQEALGGLRLVETLSNELRVRLQNIEQKLSKNPLVDWRACFHRSWSATLIDMSFNKDALLEKVSAMISGEPEEQTAAFYVMRHWLVNFIQTKDADAATTVFIAWHLEHANAALPDAAKHEVAVALEQHMLHQHDKSVSEETALAFIKIARKILPIASANKETWHYLIEFAAQIAKHVPPDQWVGFWECLAMQDDKNILIENMDHNSNGMFWYYIEQADVNRIATRILFRKNGIVRKYSQAFLEKGKTTALDTGFLSSISDKRFLLGLLSFTKNVHFDKLLLPFILGIAPRLASVADEQIKERCLLEIRMLIINYSGTLMDAIKQACAQHPVLVEPVSAAEQYYEKILKWKDSPVNSILRHELFDAARASKRMFNAQMQEAAYKGSLMAALCGNMVGVIYGDAFATVWEGEVSDPQSFHHFSTSFELPCLPAFDPEGEWWRNLQLRKEIEALENDES